MNYLDLSWSPFFKSGDPGWVLGAGEGDEQKNPSLHSTYGLVGERDIQINTSQPRCEGQQLNCVQGREIA